MGIRAYTTKSHTKDMEIVFVDTTYMPIEDSEYSCIIQAREGLSGWVKARLLKIKTPIYKAVAQFL